MQGGGRFAGQALEISGAAAEEGGGGEAESRQFNQIMPQKPETVKLLHFARLSFAHWMRLGHAYHSREIIDDLNDDLRRRADASGRH